MSGITKRLPGRSAGRGDIWLLLAPGLLALVPYLVYHRMFNRLFWFGDEFDLIDQIDRLGFWRWTWLAFAENFVPLFKVLWGGSVIAFGGSYVAMIAVVWLTHALNVVLLGRLMRSCGFAWGAVLVAQIVFGLAPSNLETLAWSVQWSAMLSVTFMLLAFDCFFRKPFGLAPFPWVLASALSFSRGVLTGVLLFAASLWTSGTEPRVGLWRRGASALVYLLPSVVVGVLIAVMVPSGNHRHMEGHWGDAALYGAWYYFLNPAHSLLGIDSVGPRTVILSGILKVALIAWGVARSRGHMRTLFVLFLAFDLGDAVLLGIGRYHTGLPTTLSSRYQYASLLAFLPVVGFWISSMWDRIPVPAAPRGLAFSCLLGVTATVLCLQWPVDLDPFTIWRGTDSRRILLTDPVGSQAVPGYPGFPMERARELIAKYSLH
jgi:hypothetical protein